MRLSPAADSAAQLLDMTLSCLDADGHSATPAQGRMWREMLAGLGIGEASSCSVMRAPSALEAVAWQAGGRIRVQGLDDAFLRSDWEGFLAGLREGHSTCEVAFGDGLGCATALGVEWCLRGGRSLCASFAGIGNLPALEEVVMALWTAGMFRGDTRVLGDMRTWFEKVSGRGVSGAKAVVGSLVFAVESGIHVDGLVKDRRLYEPFPPEQVGGVRRLCVGTHSGRTSLVVYCGLCGIPLSEAGIEGTLARVRQLSAELERPLFPGEVAGIAEGIASGRAAGCTV